MEDFIGLVSCILTDLALAKVTYNNFHNLTFPLTRDAFGVFLIQHSLEHFLFPEGVVGERPLTFSLSKFGNLSRNSKIVSLSDPLAYLRASSKNKFQCEFSAHTRKVADSVPQYVNLSSNDLIALARSHGL